MKKQKDEKFIDQQNEVENNPFSILKQKIYSYQKFILELEEQVEMKQKRNKIIEQEIKLKWRDQLNLEKLFEINKELEINEIKSQNNEQKSNSSTTIYYLFNQKYIFFISQYLQILNKQIKYTTQQNYQKL